MKHCQNPFSQLPLDTNVQIPLSIPSDTETNLHMTCKRQILNIHYATVSFYEDMVIEEALIMAVQITDFSDGRPNRWKKNNICIGYIQVKLTYYFFFVFYLKTEKQKQ